MEKKIAVLQNDKQKLLNDAENLKIDLDARCSEMESRMPYVNNLIEEKNTLEKELQKSLIENKRKDHLI